MNQNYLGEQKIRVLAESPDCAWLNEPLPLPDPEIMQRLQTKEPARFQYKVYLGCWCEDSRHLIPYFQAIVRACKIPQKNIRYFALDADKKSPGQIEVRDQVLFVPTIIIYEGQIEKGRIVEIASPNLESVLFDIL